MNVKWPAATPTTHTAHSTPTNTAHTDNKHTHTSASREILISTLHRPSTPAIIVMLC